MRRGLIALVGGIAIAVLFYAELWQLGHRIGEWIGEALITLIFGDF